MEVIDWNPHTAQVTRHATYLYSNGRWYWRRRRSYSQPGQGRWRYRGRGRTYRYSTEG